MATETRTIPEDEEGQTGTAAPTELEYHAGPVAVTEEADQKSFVSHAKLIGALTLVSRILGMARESVASYFFGAGAIWSAFTVAFTIPNLFRKLFGEGALSAAFIPLYAQAIKREQDPSAINSNPPKTLEQSANDFAAASVNLLCMILLALTILGELVIFALIRLNSSTSADEIVLGRLLTLKFTAIMLPYVLLICGTAFLGAILQVHKRFGAPAAAPIILNVCHVGVVLVGAKMLHLHRGLSDQTTLQ